MITTIIAALQKILRKYKASPRVTGFVQLIGSSVPEFTLNLVACMSNSPKLAIFAFSAITGSGIFGEL